MFAIEGIVNIEVIKNLLSFVYDNEEKDKISSRVTNLFGKKTFSAVFFQQPGLWSTFETIMIILLKLV